MRQNDPMPWWIWLTIMVLALLVACGFWAIVLALTGHLVSVHGHLRFIR